MPGEVRRQTLKQAKKSYKDRGQPSLSDKELKQLQRARELDQRAWRTKEQEKRRAEVAKRRADKEKEGKLERERAQLGSQRRCDRFGYQSSQFHLGKFFKVGGDDLAVAPKQTEVRLASEVESETGDGAAEEDFFEEDLDDSTILDALERSKTPVEVQKEEYSTSKPITITPPPVVVLSGRQESTEPGILELVASASPSPVVRAEEKAFAEPRIAVPSCDINLLDEDLGSFWDELDSSTQIARDLDTPQLTASRSPPSRSSSFGMDDMDLTEEDLERLDPPVLACPVKNDDMLMPPPPPPGPARQVKNNGTLMPPPPGPARQVKNDRALMPPPPPPQQRAFVNSRHVESTRASHKSTTFQRKVEKSGVQGRWRSCSVEHGFTTSELESWVDDDLVLTQIAPG